MSIISLDSQLYADIKIDGKNIPANIPNFVSELTIIENVAGIPVMSAVLNDEHAILCDEFPLTDSNRFTISVGTSMQDLKENCSFDFRLFNWAANQFQNGFKYKINAMYDNPKYTTAITAKAYKGNSTYVLSQIANHCGLDFIGTQNCLDNQTWLNLNDNLAIFAKKVVQHSYYQNGCMCLALSANGNLIYKDIIGALNGEAVAEFNSHDDSPTSGFETVYLLREYAPSSSAGFMNAWLNYGYTIIEDFLNGSTESYSSTTLTSSCGGSAVINKDVCSSIKTSRKEYTIQDAGNTHPYYWKAYHHNLRILSLFSQRFVFLVDRVTNVEPLDVISLRILNVTTGNPTAFSGKYIVGAKKTIIKGTKYAEIFEVYRNTYPKQGSLNLSNDAPPEGVRNLDRNKNSLEDVPVLTTTAPDPTAGTNKATVVVTPVEKTYAPTAETILGTSPSSTTGPTVINSTTGSGSTASSDSSTFKVKVVDLGDPV
jgi:hypothetical protein